MFRLLVCSVSSGLLVLLNTGIVDHANAQKTEHLYVKTEVETYVGKTRIILKKLPTTIDCTDATYDIKGDGVAWSSIYRNRQPRESILREYINLCGAKSILGVKLVRYLVNLRYQSILKDEMKREEERRYTEELIRRVRGNPIPRDPYQPANLPPHLRTLPWYP